MKNWNARACPIEMVITSISLIYITFPFCITVPVRTVSETTTVILYLLPDAPPNLKFITQTMKSFSFSPKKWRGTYLRAEDLHGRWCYFATWNVYISSYSRYLSYKIPKFKSWMILSIWLNRQWKTESNFYAQSCITSVII